jgi:hypothetical protein
LPSDSACQAPVEESWTSVVSTPFRDRVTVSFEDQHKSPLLDQFVAPGGSVSHDW